MTSRLLTLPQIARAALTFTAVVVAYGTYSLLAVPFIEPVAGERPIPGKGPDPTTRQQKTRHQELLESLYPDPNVWQRRRPKMVETDASVLLLKDYRTLEDGRMEIKPCTLLFIQQDAKSRADGHPGRVVVLDAPEGAILQFDEDVDLRRGEFGRLVGGRLAGEVTIRSNESAPGADDQIFLSTHNVNMDERRMWTPNEVSFRYGRSYGKGRDLIVSFLPAVETGNSRGPNIGGLKSLEIVHLERLHLVAGQSLFSDPNGDAQQRQKDEEPDNGATTRPGQDLAASPVEVSCKGPFLFDLEEGVATFEEQVDVLRLNPNAPSDQLNCRWLEIHFEGLSTSRSKDAEASPPAVSKLVALGYPVILNSPSMGAHARGERLEYDILQRQVRLDGEQPVLLDYQGRRIEALAVQYTMPEAGRIGSAWAQGPGRFRAEIPADSSDQAPRFITATWQDELRLRPDGDLHVLSLLGDARIGDQTFGVLQANQLHLWLRVGNEFGAMTPPDGSPSGDSGSILPDRLLAEGTVRLDSPALTGSTQRFEVWFHHVPLETLAQTEPPADDSATVPQPWRNQTQEPTARFDISGDVLRAQLAVAGKTVQLRDVSVEGKANILETHTAEAGAMPVRISGDFVHVAAANSPQAKAVVSGKPAIVSGRGVTLKGTSIHMDRALNRVTVPGVGEATLPMSAGLGSQPKRNQSPVRLSSPAARPRRDNAAQASVAQSPATVTWNDGMQFDGKTVQLHGAVEARTDQQKLTAPLVEIELTQHVSLSKPPKDRAIDVQQVRLKGQVTLENRTVVDGELISIDEMMVRDLKIDQQSGNLSADGPGWMKTVRRGSNLGPGQFTGPAFGTASQPAETAPPSKDEFSYLRVTFQTALTGNVHQRHVQLHGGVRAVYGPVKHWDATIDPDQALQSIDNVVLLTSDTLQVAEMGGGASAESAGGLGPVELQALGNAMVEGKTFTARAHRIAYAQSKDLLVMEGDGRTDAELYRQTAVGGQTGRASARKILYWPGTGRMDVDTFNSLDWSGMPASLPSSNVLPSSAQDYLRRERESRPPGVSTPPR